VTLDEWLNTRDPAPPPALDARIREIVGPRVTVSVAEAPETLLAIAETQLARLVTAGASGRGGDAALDLLAVDALVTYAYEAASAQPDGGRALAAVGVSRLAAASPRLHATR
jgi:hypothetical protein